MSTKVELPGWSALTEFGDEPVVVGPDSVWVRLSDSEIARIDPASSEISGRYPTDPAGGGGHLLLAFDALWVANAATDSVWKQQIRTTG